MPDDASSLQTQLELADKAIADFIARGATVELQVNGHATKFASLESLRAWRKELSDRLDRLSWGGFVRLSPVRRAT